ncbi:hypothetical protein TBC1_111852 [Lentimicrobium saccharophilum]|uniref:DUF3795 domain-containing protein n=1 Tax=Lentimicrobium saccharophilum TaxID=1678841 RepID=A0A0S7C4H6_9BACT|nr:DUF3795 domain-containing protein [Lentimicrobium saccharophilum]GAP43695.1 hypothetical protein TBC1_111852 [Lentimicrobium saccharophilum]
MENHAIPEKAAVCGLYCGACGIFLATQSNDTEKLAQYAVRLNQPVEETRCLGCRSNTKTAWCRACKMVSCAAGKGVDFCGSCNEYPCKALKDFQAMMPHRAGLWESQARIAEAGPEVWMREMEIHFACPACGKANTSYDIKCPSCGNIPGNHFAGKHSAMIKEYLSKLSKS